MPVQAFWDDEQHTIVRLHFAGRWTWDELGAASLQMTAMVQACPDRVDLISDMLDTMYLPPRYVESMQALSGRFPPFPNLRLVVLAGQHQSYAVLFELVRNESVVSFEVGYASNLDAARALIAQARRGGDSLPGYGRWASGQ